MTDKNNLDILCKQNLEESIRQGDRQAMTALFASNYALRLIWGDIIM